LTFRPSLSAIVGLALAVSGLVHAQPTVQRLDDSIVFEGRIDAASAAEFLALVTDPAVRRLVITSAGGLVSPALDMADAIHARGLDVEVPHTCFSSCANYIFPAGRRKVLGRPGTVGWHGNMAHVLHLQQSGQASWPEPVIADARRLARREADFFRRAGVDGLVCWFAKLPPYAVEDFYWLSVDDMERFGIRDVTVRDPDRPRVAADLQPVSVDWPLLQATRPVVRLDE
jgi:hypothetical protein